MLPTPSLTPHHCHSDIITYPRKRRFCCEPYITIQCSDQGIPQRSSGDTILLQIYKDDSTVPVTDVTSVSNGRMALIVIIIILTVVIIILLILVVVTTVTISCNWLLAKNRMSAEITTLTSEATELKYTYL